METLHEVTLDRLVYGGDAMGRLPDGRAVFAPFGLPGERVRLRLTEEKRGHARGEIVERLSAAAQRITPRCPHFGECGGCHYQHLPYEAQLQAKGEIVRDQLARIAGLEDAPLDPVVPSPLAWNYRNHIQFHVSPEGRLGFQAARSHRVVPITECHLPVEAINEVWPRLELEPGSGVQRVSLRLGEGDELLLGLESDTGDAPEFSVEELELSAVHLSHTGSVVLAGSPYLFIQVLERNFRVSAESFFQVNTPAAEKLVAHVLEQLPLNPGQLVLDAYCGVGLFSAFLAARGARLVGIESSPAACEDFAWNLDEYDEVSLYEAAVEDALPALAEPPAAALLDPPRGGLAPRVIDELLRLGPPRLVYVSCDPATLARDARRLLAGGYRLERVTPFDLFPQTYHIESVSVFSNGV